MPYVYNSIQEPVLPPVHGKNIVIQFKQQERYYAAVHSFKIGYLAYTARPDAKDNGQYFEVICKFWQFVCGYF